MDAKKIRSKGSYALNKHHGFWGGKRLSARYLRARDRLSLPPSPAQAAADQPEPTPHRDDDWDYNDYDHDYRDQDVPDPLGDTWSAYSLRLEAAAPFNAPRIVGARPRVGAPQAARHARHARGTIEQRVVDHLCMLGQGRVDSSSVGPLARAELVALHELAYGPQQPVPVPLATALCMFQPLWIRSPASWDPAQTPSLIEHLLVEYPIPRFLLRVWQSLPRELELRFIAWVITLGQGGSLRRLMQLAQASACPGAWDSLPKKLPGLLTQVPDTLSPTLGLMYAEVLRLGGTGVEFKRLHRDQSYAVDPTCLDPETHAFWAGSVRWLARHRDQLDDERCAMILAWAQHLHTERRADTTAFDWAGRTPESAGREALAYRQRYFRPRYHHVRSSLKWAHHGWDGEHQVDGEIWSFAELVSSEQLWLETKAMHHCVSGYDVHCARGYSAIFSMTRAGERCLTVEVRLPAKQVVQVRGVCNRLPSAAEQAVIRRWVLERLR